MPVPRPRLTALVLTPPGVGSILRDEARHRGLATGRVASDGRSDVVPVRGDPATVRALRCRDDVLIDLGSVRIARTADATAAQLDRAVARASAEILRLGGRRQRHDRVVVRMTTEHWFKRTALRDAVERRRQSLRLPPLGELWLLQTSADRICIGVRIEGWTRRTGRPVEREGSLPSAVAAAMVALAGPARGRLLDPCCGSGTILIESSAAGWDAAGGDVDPRAIDVSRANAGVPVAVLDSRRLPFPPDTFDAVVSNLPFGHRHTLQGTPVAWYRRMLTEAIRVAPTAVVLAPPSAPFRQALGRLNVSLDGSWDVSIRGQRASIWRVTRRVAGIRL